MPKKLYVGNLPYSVTQADLEKMFSEKWTVLSTTLITDKYSGRSKGFGFVEIESDEDAAAAVEGLNGFDIEGRAIVVNEARPKKEGDRGGRGGFKKRQY
ncbi:MAG: RNA-binding protein [Candidatus Brocadiales bacterium]